MDPAILATLILASAPPLLFAVIGETLTEKAGVLNLSLDGSLLLSAMAAFVTAYTTGSLGLGFAAGALVGVLVALVVAVAGLTLRVSMVATGFVLALLARDLSYVLGDDFTHLPGPQVPSFDLPLLAQLPCIGPVLFKQNLVVYAALLLVIGAWWFLGHTRHGLELVGVGEAPMAAYARGIRVTRRRYFYTLLGGALVGIGGASFSLMVKPGWARPYGIEGTGWIALAIVIFGNWRPLRAAFGAFLFVALQSAANTLQTLWPAVPTQIFPTLPFPLMIFTLLVVNLGDQEWMENLLAKLPPRVRAWVMRVFRLLRSAPPGAIGQSLR